MASTEQRFLEQAQEFVELTLAEWNYASVKDTVDILEQPPVPLTPIVIDDFRKLTEAELDRMADAYYGVFGTAYYIARNPDDEPDLGHMVLDISEQLVGRIPVEYPLAHEKDVKKITISRLGEAHG